MVVDESEKFVRIIGLISGTSVDGIDAALVEVTGKGFDLSVQLLAGDTFPYPGELRSTILEVCQGKALPLAELAALDDAIAQTFAQAAQTIQQGFPQADLIGSHGQTVFHRPTTPQQMGYSLQLGRGALIAQLTGIPTISNFRVADIAVGGQGAPLVSRVDAYLLSHDTHHRVVQNIGGIGNLTYLPPRQGDWMQQITGWDTGPGNTLLDLAVQHFTQGEQSFDRDGAWAAQGMPCEPLLTRWLADPYFRESPPKSTGRELFGQAYFQHCLADAQEFNLSAADLLATLTELTAKSIISSYGDFLPRLPDQVLVCGGGCRNRYLLERLKLLAPEVDFYTTTEFGVNADFKEAIAFAVLAYWRHLGQPGNLPAVTGAKQLMPLGELNLP